MQFLDPRFPPSLDSLGDLASKDAVVWENAMSSELFSEQFEIRRGIVKDDWLLDALSLLVASGRYGYLRRRIFERI